MRVSGPKEREMGDAPFKFLERERTRGMLLLVFGVVEEWVKNGGLGALSRQPLRQLRD